jgi:hypothetical protein
MTSRESWALTPATEKVTLADCPIGLFVNSFGCICLKTEYGNNAGRIDAYIVDSGEFFWGEHPQTIENQRKQLVTPLTCESLQPNPTPPADVAEDDAEILAEGWRVLQRLKDADNEMKWEPDYGAQAIVALAQDNAQAWAFDNFEFLLRAASENVSLREQVVSANEQRDAAVREVERLKTALKFYSEGFVELNPGTLRVEDITGRVVWPVLALVMK